MKIYALNGFQYPIQPRMSPGILPYVADYPYYGNWTPRRAALLSDRISEPSILFGFSDGAEAAARIAAKNPNIKILVIHSIMGAGISVPKSVELFAFRTSGDRTPTYDGTKKFFDQQSHGQLLTLLPSPFPGPKTMVERRFLEPLKHQFHNAIPLFVAILNRASSNGS